MEEDAKIAAQKSGRLSFYVVNAIADGCTWKNARTFSLKRKCVWIKTLRRFVSNALAFLGAPESAGRLQNFFHNLLYYLNKSSNFAS